MEVLDKGNAEKSDTQKMEEQAILRKWQADESRNKFFGGFLLIGIGLVILLKQLHVEFPDWFSWPLALIAVGVFIGIKDNFEKPTWLIVSFIGFVFLLGQYYSLRMIMPYAIPIGLILLGMFIIVKPSTSWYAKKKIMAMSNDTQSTVSSGMAYSSGEDWIDSSAVFGSLKRNVISKQFRGGEVNAVFGGGELNLSQADFTGVAKLELNAVFGGIRLVVPPTWEIKSELNAVFGGAEDKRPYNPNNAGNNKLLILEGNAVFGGIEIVSFSA